MKILSHNISKDSINKIFRRFYMQSKWGNIGKNSRVVKPMRIINRRKIFIGNDVIILNGARMETWDNGEIHIGDGTSIEQGCHIIATDTLTIGKDCMLSAWIYIADCNHIYNSDMKLRDAGLKTMKTRVGNNVFIGIGAKIMPGVTIGDHAVIGANAVVTHDIPGYQIWGGVPAKFISEIRCNDAED